jgi:hypothetical protein
MRVPLLASLLVSCPVKKEGVRNRMLHAHVLCIPPGISLASLQHTAAAYVPLCWLVGLDVWH